MRFEFHPEASLTEEIHHNSNISENEAKRPVENLPETASWDDLMYEVHVRQKIEEGIKAADEGRVLAHEEVRKRFGTP